MLFKIRRKTIWRKHYDTKRKEDGIVSKPTTKIMITFFGLPIKTLHRYRKEYDGIVVSVDKNNNPIYTTKTREKFLKSKIKHSKTRDFVIGNLNQIIKNAESEEAKSIAKKTLKQLKSNKDYSVDVTPF